ncbi:hypothetical protein [Chitinophaga vietnamensis]|uniref:hypothetical protein n=1 Tax=Chitinophaga vietnamensis TaxID=2593957 RepID=UPI0011777DAF|nr:hypothetical protein [Chitinophaga vietnamensis]
MKRNHIYCLIIVMLCSCKSKKEEVKPRCDCDVMVTEGYFSLMDQYTGDNLVFGAHAKIKPDSIFYKFGTDSMKVFWAGPPAAPAGFMHLPFNGAPDTLLINTGGKHYVLSVANYWKMVACCEHRLIYVRINDNTTPILADSTGRVNVLFSLN